METDNIERIEQRFKQRYQVKKAFSLLISIVIAVLGITSVVYNWHADRNGLMTFRWMTVDGTIFTIVLALFYIIVSIVEILHYTELTNSTVYFLRLASAVTESLIMVVVLFSQIPLFPRHMRLFRYDMFSMHVVIPILTVLSFILNDPPIGKLTFLQKLYGTWFITLYTAVILPLIIAGIIPQNKIPYFFLDVFYLPVPAFLGLFILIYALSYLLSYCISAWNRKLSWLWFRGVVSKGNPFPD